VTESNSKTGPLTNDECCSSDELDALADAYNEETPGADCAVASDELGSVTLECAVNALVVGDDGVL